MISIPDTEYVADFLFLMVADHRIQWPRSLLVLSKTNKDSGQLGNRRRVKYKIKTSLRILGRNGLYPLQIIKYDQLPKLLKISNSLLKENLLLY